VACITTYQHLLFRYHGYIHAKIADWTALLEHATNNEELFRNHGRVSTRINGLLWNYNITLGSK
jgi:hypothetical protein